MDWWTKYKEDKEKEKKEREAKEAELSPEKILEALKAESEARKTTESKVDSILKGLESVTAFATEYKTDKEKREAAEAEAARRRAAKTPEQQQEEAEALAAALIDDPAGTVNKLTQNTQKAILELKADSLRKEVFESAEEFPYYNGEIKSEIDKIIAAQTLDFRCNPESIKNAYYTVVGRKQKDIQEGKVKSRFASSSQSLHTEGDSKKEGIKIEIDDNIRRAAKLSGMKPEDYAELLSKEAAEGNISYV